MVEPEDIMMNVELVNTGIVMSIYVYLDPVGRICRDIDECRAGQHKYSY